MAPNGRCPQGSHYSNIDDWKTDSGKENATHHLNEVRHAPPTSPRPHGPKCGWHDMVRPVTLARRTRNCCRTNHEIPCGPHFPIEETLDSMGEWKPAGKPVKHLEYGYEATWRPSRTVVPLKDIMVPCVVTPANAQFRSSIKVINSGTGAWSEKWRASKKYIDPGRSKDYEWRSSVRTSHPQRMGHEVDYRPQVRPSSANSGLETNQGRFKPTRRYIIPHTPIKEPAPYQQKRYIAVPPEWVPPFRIQGEDYNTAPMKRHGRGMVGTYDSSHPPLCLSWESSNRLASAPYAMDHQPVEEGEPKRRPQRNHSASGPYHEAVSDRDPISGHMPETDVFQPTKVPVGPALYGPAGSINTDIIDHKFSDLFQKGTPISEMKDQFRRR